MTALRHLELTFPPEPGSVAQARTQVVQALTPQLDADHLETLRLLVSELVTNAFRHGMPPITLTTELHRDFLRVEVADSGGGRPRRRARPSADGGWGLLLVEQASDRWGVADGSMRVWFEIDR
jgi:anti-sigma regulatory factor (Ser/Thr protein kinase)